MTAPEKKVIVLLTDDWIDCLKTHSAEIHTCKACLERAVDVRTVFSGSRLAWSIGCSEEEVRELLAVASRHCAAAVGAIRDSLERFTAPP
jgi:hypothetical protein